MVETDAASTLSLRAQHASRSMRSSAAPPTARRLPPPPSAAAAPCRAAGALLRRATRCAAAASPADVCARLPYLPYALLETADVIVFDKPPGLSFLEEDGEAGLLQVLRHLQARGTLRYQGRLFPVHRLDRVTSGCVALAKSAAAAGELTGAFRERRVVKYYAALSDRRPAKKMGARVAPRHRRCLRDQQTRAAAAGTARAGTVAGDMARSRRGSWKLLHSAENPAVTHFVSCGLEWPPRPGLRAFLIKPDTGRTHQIRVALKALGAPILGDERYAAADAAAAEDRTYLHAAALRCALRPGVAPLQVVCPPRAGALFAAPQFGALFARWFPPGTDASAGDWFPHAPPLSAPLPPPGRAGAPRPLLRDAVAGVSGRAEAAEGGVWGEEEADEAGAWEDDDHEGTGGEGEALAAEPLTRPPMVVAGGGADAILSAGWIVDSGEPAPGRGGSRRGRSGSGGGKPAHGRPR